MGVVEVLTVWFLPEVLNVEPTAEGEKTKTRQGERLTFVEDRQDRTRSSPSTRHIIPFQSESRVYRTRRLDRL